MGMAWGPMSAARTPMRPGTSVFGLCSTFCWLGDLSDAAFMTSPEVKIALKVPLPDFKTSRSACRSFFNVEDFSLAEKTSPRRRRRLRLAGGEGFASQAEKASSRRRRRLRLEGGEGFVSQAEKAEKVSSRRRRRLRLAGGEGFVSLAEKASSRRRRRLHLASGEDFSFFVVKNPCLRHESNIVDMSVHNGPEVLDGIDADDPIGLLRDFDNLTSKTRHGTDHPSSLHGPIGVTNVMVGDLGIEVTTESLSADATVRSSSIDDMMETSGTRVATRSSGVVDVEGLRVSEVGGPSAAETTSPESLVGAHVRVVTKSVRRGGDVEVVDTDDNDVKADDDDVEADDDDVEADKDDVEADDDDVEADKYDIEADDDEDGNEERSMRRSMTD
ncbi:hypothetical protein AALP_AAs39623U000300 [Arabis alpina]|uniref:Uncharacterized protein n=1 Tax=Arabis alpina TaxID=50452 RepID=A0A087FY23_ARAAL|nr:hypothetical protein AALP_AAs39623U000300 [Arabis alpina]